MKHNELKLQPGWKIEQRGSVWTVINARGGEYCRMTTPWNEPRQFASAEAVLAEMVTRTIGGSPLYTFALLGGEEYEAAYQRWIDEQTAHLTPGLSNAASCANAEAI